MRTQRAIKECGRWLAECLRLGWSRDQLDALETLWWQHHDDQGRLVPARVTAASTPFKCAVDGAVKLCQLCEPKGRCVGDATDGVPASAAQSIADWLRQRRDYCLQQAKQTLDGRVRSIWLRDVDCFDRALRDYTDGVGASGQQVFCEKTPMVRNEMPRADGREG